MTVVLGPCSEKLCTVYIAGPLLWPISRDLRHNVRRLLRRGVRRVVLDLARVSKIDAAGVGELVRAYNMTDAVDGRLRIAHPGAWVHEVLRRAGLFDRLSLEGGLE